MKFWSWYRPRFASFTGRLNRRQLLTYFGGLYAFLFIGTAVSNFLATASAGNLSIGLILGPVVLIFIVGAISLQVRRFHDFGKSGYHFAIFVLIAAIISLAQSGLPETYQDRGSDPTILIILVSFFATSAGLIILFWPGSPLPNAYGSPPDNSWLLQDKGISQSPLENAEVKSESGSDSVDQSVRLNFFKPNTKFPTGTVFLQRLGLVTWWAGSAAAFFSAFISIGFLFAGEYQPALLLFVIGAALWLLGRCSLYLLTSR